MKTLNLGWALLFACSAPNDPVPVKPPTVETVLVSVSDALVVAVCKSNSPIHGICWGQSPNPSMGGSWAEGDTVTFPVTAREKYYVRAFAKNGAGTFYGENIDFLSICPSDLAGEVTYITQVVYSSGPYACTTVTGTTTLTDQGNGIYQIGDASFGLYACAWGDSPATGVSLEDTCGKFSFRGRDQYGLSYSLTMISPNVFQWTNEYGDSAITTIQF